MASQHRTPARGGGNAAPCAIPRRWQVGTWGGYEMVTFATIATIATQKETPYQRVIVSIRRFKFLISRFAPDGRAKHPTAGTPVR